MAAGGQTTFEAIRAGGELSDRGIIADSDVNAALAQCGDMPPTARALMAQTQYDKSIRLGLVAAWQALAQAGWLADDAAKLHSPRTGLFVGTSKGPVHAVFAAIEQMRMGKTLDPILARQVALGPASLATLLNEALGITGGRGGHTSIAACSSSIHALHAAARAIKRGECDRALVVAADASVHPLFEGAFTRLGVFAKSGFDGHARCRPLQIDPQQVAEPGGFFLSEAAAALTLERPEDVTTSRDRGAIILEETWIGADATSLVAIDEQTQSLRQGLRQMAELGADQNVPVALVHAHATGTDHDAHEWAAIRAVFPSATLDIQPQKAADNEPHLPRVFSHKRYLGHSLGAAGLVAVVLSALCQKHGLTPTGTKLPADSRSLTISQGFGGHIGITALRSAFSTRL